MPRRLLTWCLASVLFFAAFAVPRAETPAAPKPNYDLAANWTAQKVGRLVFDTTVTPRWLESGDRFWYPYQTREGRRFYLVDPVKKTQGAAVRPREDGRDAHVDHARSLRRAAPAVHDGQVRQERHGVRVRRPGAARRRHGHSRESPRSRPMQQGAARQGGQDPGRRRRGDPQQQGQRGRGGARAAAPSRREPDAALRVRHGDRAASTSSTTTTRRRSAPRWASPSPDGKTIVFARNHNLFMMDAANYAQGAKEGRRHGDRRDAADEGRRGALQLRARRRSSCSRSRNSSSNNSRNRGEQQQQTEPTRIRQPTRTRACRRSTSSGRGTRRSSRSSAAISARSTDLWVINALAQPRPTLETYRYAMPGEENIPQSR